MNAVRADIYYDHDTNYYINGNSVSYLNDLRPNIIYDRNNTGYYLNPDSTSNLNSTYSNEFYANNWFRNQQAGEGMYNQATGSYWYSESASWWISRSNAGIIVRNNAGTTRGHIYHNDGGGSFGLLSANGHWRVRVDNSNTELYGGVYVGTLYANFIYDRQNTGFYVDPNGTTHLSTLLVDNFSLPVMAFSCLPRRSLCEDGDLNLGARCMDLGYRGYTNAGYQARECAVRNMETCTLMDYTAAMLNRTAPASPYQGGGSFSASTFNNCWTSDRATDSLIIYIPNSAISYHDIDAQSGHTNRYFYCCYNK